MKHSWFCLYNLLYTVTPARDSSYDVYKFVSPSFHAVYYDFLYVHFSSRECILSIKEMLKLVMHDCVSVHSAFVNLDYNGQDTRQEEKLHNNVCMHDVHPEEVVSCDDNCKRIMLDN